MNKFIGFDMDHKKTVACVVAEGRPDVYTTLPSELDALYSERLLRLDQIILIHCQNGFNVG